ncbi:MAG: hypothetical protein MR292_04185 [Alistipes sp.]|nr:hypothetical protein [Alistipes sp.]
MSTDIRRFRRRPNGTAPPAEGFTPDFCQILQRNKAKGRTCTLPDKPDRLHVHKPKVTDRDKGPKDDGQEAVNRGTGKQEENRRTGEQENKSTAREQESKRARKQESRKAGKQESRKARVQKNRST